MAAEGKKSKSDAAKAVKRSARALALSTQAAESAAPTKAKKGDGAAAASTPESESSAPKKAKKGEGSSARILKRAMARQRQRPRRASSF